MNPIRLAVGLLTAALLFAPALVADEGEKKEEGKKDAAKIAAMLAKTKISLADAITAAEKAAGGTAVEAAIEQDDDTLVYEVLVVAGTPAPLHEVSIDVGTGKVLEDSKLSSDADVAKAAKLAELLKKATVALSAATKTAEEKAGATAYEAEFEEEGGAWNHEMGVVTKGDKPTLRDVKVDAATGKVLADEEEGAEEKKDEDKDDDGDEKKDGEKKDEKKDEK